MTILDRPFDNHDRIMQTPLHLGDELLRPAPQDQGTGFCLGALFKQVEALSTDLLLLESPTLPKMVRFDI